MKEYADKNYIRAKTFALRQCFLKKEEYIKIINSGSLIHMYPELSASIEKDNYLELKKDIVAMELKGSIEILHSNEKFASTLKNSFYELEENNLRYIILNFIKSDFPVYQWFDFDYCNVIENNLKDKELSLHDLLSLLKQFNIEIDDNEDFIMKDFLNSNFESTLYFQKINIFFKLMRNLNKRDSERILYLSIFTIISNLYILAIRQRKNYKISENEISEFLENGIQKLEKLGIAKKNFLSIYRYIDERVLQHGIVVDKEMVQVDVSQVEVLLQNMHYSIVDKLYFSDFHSIISLICFQWFTFYQIKNLFTIIEGFRFNVSIDEISKRMVWGL